jgi:hypothetical protein
MLLLLLIICSGINVFSSFLSLIQVIRVMSLSFDVYFNILAMHVHRFFSAFTVAALYLAKQITSAFMNLVQGNK